MNETKKISVTDIVKKCKNYNSDKARDAFLSATIQVHKYVPYMQKVATADLIIKNSCLDDKGNVFVDSAKKYILYVVSLISHYTNIDVNDDAAVEEYDLLSSSGLLETIIKLIPEKELGEFRTIVQMKYDDLLTNAYEPHAFITKKIAETYAGFSPAVGKALDYLSEFISMIDIAKVESALK